MFFQRLFLTLAFLIYLGQSVEWINELLLEIVIWLNKVKSNLRIIVLHSIENLKVLVANLSFINLLIDAWNHWSFSWKVGVRVPLRMFFFKWGYHGSHTNDETCNYMIQTYSADILKQEIRFFWTPLYLVHYKYSGDKALDSWLN